MINYINQRIKTLKEKHHEYKNFQDTTMPDEELHMMYSAKAASTWDTICELQNIADYKHPSDEALTSGPVKLVSLRVWTHEYTVSIQNEDATVTEITAKREKDQSVIDCIKLAKNLAHDYLCWRTDYIITNTKIAEDEADLRTGQGC